MTQATIRDTREGYRLFLQYDGAIDMDELNERLAISGYLPVSSRTIRHYRNLFEAGFNRYISINRFEISRRSQPYDDLFYRSRYSYRPANIEVALLFPKNLSEIELVGQAIQVCDIGTLIHIRGDSALAMYEQLRPRYGDAVTVWSNETRRTVEGRVVESHLNYGQDGSLTGALIEIEYLGLLSVIEDIGSRQLPTERYWLEVVPIDGLRETMDELGRQFHSVFDVLEGLRAMLNEAAQESESDSYVSPPIVEELTVSSPASLILQVSPVLIELMIVVYGLLHMRNLWFKGSETKERVLQSRDQRIADETERRRNDQRIQEVENSTCNDLARAVLSAFPTSRSSSKKLRRIAHKEVILPLRRIRDMRFRKT